MAFPERESPGASGKGTSRRTRCHCRSQPRSPTFPKKSSGWLVRGSPERVSAGADVGSPKLAVISSV